jgi:hypothetical protein
MACEACEFLISFPLISRSNLILKNFFFLQIPNPLAQPFTAPPSRTTIYCRPLTPLTVPIAAHVILNYIVP